MSVYRQPALVGEIPKTITLLEALLVFFVVVAALLVGTFKKTAEAL